MFEGLPQLDAEGWYLGPLPKKTGEPLIGREGGVFRTASAAEWPQGLCDWVATQILASFQQNSDKREGQENNQENKKKSPPDESPPGENQHGSKRQRVEEQRGKGKEENTDPFDPRKRVAWAPRDVAPGRGQAFLSMMGGASCRQAGGKSEGESAQAVWRGYS